MVKKIQSPEEIQKRFDTLPADIKTAVYGADMLNLLQKIGQTNKLHLDQMDVLEAETADVMTGFSKPEEFVANIIDSLSIDKSQAEKIAHEINEGLFLKIRESLKNIHSQAQTGQKQSPSIATEPNPADVMLSQKTVSSAPVAPSAPNPPASQVVPSTTSASTPSAPQPPQPKVDPAAPQPYKADPYREPVDEK
jgi:hypothetical protein